MILKLFRLGQDVKVPRWQDPDSDVPTDYPEGRIMEIDGNLFTVVFSRNAAFVYTREELSKWN